MRFIDAPMKAYEAGTISNLFFNRFFLKTRRPWQSNSSVGNAGLDFPCSPTHLQKLQAPVLPLYAIRGLPDWPRFPATRLRSVGLLTPPRIGLPAFLLPAQGHAASPTGLR